MFFGRIEGKEVKYMNLKYKITTAIATGTMIAALVVPSAFAAKTVTIKNNGAGSVNGAAVVKASKSTVKQSNATVVGTSVTSVQNSGGNKIKGNLGGTNSVTTGVNRTTTTVTVAGGTNASTGESCCCGDEGATDVEISGNQALSLNGVLVVDLCKNKVKQSNATIVGTSVTTVQNSGGNTVKWNLGGDNVIGTGNNVTDTTVTVEGSSNTNGGSL